MKKITYIFTVIILILLNHSIDIYAEKDLQKSNDTLMVGGIYRILLTDGRDLTGEITGLKDSTIAIRVNYENFIFKKSEIKAIEFGGKLYNEDIIELTDTPYKNKIFRMIGSVQTGLAFPTGGFENVYKTSSGIQIAAYKLFNRATGIGVEFQYNNFHGTVYYKEETYVTYKTETESFNSSFLKVNFILGNLAPERNGFFYALLGIGLQYNTEGNITNTTIRHSSSESYKTSGYSGASLMYGTGFGLNIKVSKKIGVNVELQFNKISGREFYYSDGVNGFFSIKAGIMYTNF